MDPIKGLKTAEVQAVEQLRAVNERLAAIEALLEKILKAIEAQPRPVSG